jgi:hypothetical protein
VTSGRRPLFSNSTIWIVALLFAYPLQVVVLVVAQLRNDLDAASHSTHIGAYACTNFVHGSTPFRCNISRLVRNAAEGALMLDVFTFGAPFFLALFAIAICLIGVRTVHLRLWARPKPSLERTRER